MEFFVWWGAAATGAAAAPSRADAAAAPVSACLNVTILLTCLYSLPGPGPRARHDAPARGATIRPVASRPRTTLGQPTLVRMYPGRMPAACGASHGQPGPDQPAKAGSS